MKCFIISPIGQPNSPVRQHADAVFKCIIEPALNETNVLGHRADHVIEVGRVTEQMYDAILSSDFCFALLHDRNPNVYYELAVAHSAGIPVILLAEKGTDAPFDIKDERSFPYDLSPLAIYDRDNVKRLVPIIESLRNLGGAKKVPFGDNLTPLNAGGSVLPYRLELETSAPGEFWLQLVRGARKRLFLSGIGLTGWKGMPGMFEAISATAAAGCEIRILTMDGDNPAFACMLNPNVSAASHLAQGPSNSETRAWFQNAFASGPKAEVRALKSGLCYQQIIISDGHAVITPYLYSAGTSHSPRLEIEDAHPVFAKFLHEFETLWKVNSPT